ncbi:MAG: S8 family serine peptidase [Anaerotignaceae bacterium]
MHSLTHVAGIACGNGYLSHKKYTGIAPQSNIICLKILDELGHGSSSAALDAIRWIGKNKDTYNIRVVNLSIGTNDKTIASPLVKEVNSLWEKGVVVVAASGNDERNGIASPGISQKIITVGSIEEQVHFRIKSGNMIYYKPDVFAPGENIISCKADEFSFQGKKRSGKSVIDNYYVRMSGTSMATPMVSATAALILQHAPNLSPDTVKRIICNAANNNRPDGLLNIEKIFYG